MNPSECCDCGKAKAQLVCGACEQSVCKSCAHFVEAESFSFLGEVPEILQKGVYCRGCFEKHVAPAQAAYDSVLNRAKDVNVYLKKQSKETRLIRRLEKPVQVTGCPDRDKTLLRLAFLAAQKGYNGLVDVELGFEKVRDHAYQTCIWFGIGTPVQVDAARNIPDRALWQNPN